MNARREPVAHPTNRGEWFRVFMPTSAWVLTAAVAVLSIPMLYIAAGDPDGEYGILAQYMFVGIIPAVWSVLQPLWVRYRDLPAIYLSLVRVIVVPAVAAPFLALVAAVTVMLPPITERIAAHTTAAGSHYYFAERDGSPLFQAAVLGGLANAMLGMIVGLALVVFVVLPYIAFRRPREFAHANMYDTAPEHTAANSAAGRFLAIVLMLAFAVPTLIIWGSNEAYARSIDELWGSWWKVLIDPERHWGDALWMLGLALIPLAIVAVVLARVLQRPDRDKRAHRGLNALGDD